MRLAFVTQLAVGFLVFERAFKKLPQLEIRDEIRFFMVEALLRHVGGLSAVHGPLARILHRQRRGNHQHFGKAALLLRGQHHATDARIQRQARELPAGLGEELLLIQRAQLLQQGIAVGNRLGGRGINEGKFLDLGQAQRLHAKNHCRQ